MFEQLSDDLKKDALDEFVGLIDTGKLYPQVTEIFAKATPVVQSRIIQRLSNAAPFTRQIFANVLYDHGLAQGIPDAWITESKAWNSGHVEVRLPNAETAHTQP
jgi:hypothetical protein